MPVAFWTLVMEFNGEKLYNINFTYLNEYQDIKECKSVETYSAAAVKAFETIQKISELMDKWNFINIKS